MSHAHMIKVCACGTVIEQCRCMSPNKARVVVSQGCPKCLGRGAAAAHTFATKPSDPQAPCVNAKVYCLHCKICGAAVREGLLYCPGLSVCWRKAMGLEPSIVKVVEPGTGPLISIGYIEWKKP